MSRAATPPKPIAPEELLRRAEADRLPIWKPAVILPSGPCNDMNAHIRGIYQRIRAKCELPTDQADLERAGQVVASFDSLDALLPDRDKKREAS